MANLIVHRPNAHCHPAEIRVAEFLRELDDRWTVVWGYFYKDFRGHSREGDFLILGPAGGLLVLEVKSSIPRWFSDTGQWEGETTSPVDQLMGEWSSIRDLVRNKGIRLWVAKALCVPYEVASRELVTCQGIPRNLLVLRNDLEHWLRTWLGLFDKKVEQPVMPSARDAVFALFSASVKPGDRRFLPPRENGGILRSVPPNTSGSAGRSGTSASRPWRWCRSMATRFGHTAGRLSRLSRPASARDCCQQGIARFK